MKKAFLKAIISFSSVTMLTSLCSISATAHTVADNYSEFSWSMSNTFASVSIKNTSGSSRYASVFISGYDSYGNYAGSMGNSGVITTAPGTQSTKGRSGYLYDTATSASFSGSLYLTESPYGTPLSSWYRTIG